VNAMIEKYIDELISEGLINAKNASAMRVILGSVIRAEKKKSMKVIENTIAYLEEDDWIRITIEKELN
jgi:hypothetical protein